jgi:hypothetical protein
MSPLYTAGEDGGRGESSPLYTVGEDGGRGDQGGDVGASTLVSIIPSLPVNDGVDWVLLYTTLQDSLLASVLRMFPNALER